jgi:hypothetical protein
MRATGGWLVAGWLVAALVVLSMDGRLPAFLAWTVPGSLLALGLGALVHQQLAPSAYNRPGLPERHLVADDLGRPLVEVIAAAEREALAGREEVPDGHLHCRAGR